MDLEVELWCWINNLLHSLSLEHVFSNLFINDHILFSILPKKEKETGK